MAKMINVDELIEFCNTERTMLHAHGESTACAALRRLSEYTKDNAVEAEPVKHGRWIDNGSNMWLCSYCKENLIYSETKIDRAEKQRYCSRCGAKMDGDTNE